MKDYLPNIFRIMVGAGWFVLRKIGLAGCIAVALTACLPEGSYMKRRAENQFQFLKPSIAPDNATVSFILHDRANRRRSIVLYHLERNDFAFLNVSPDANWASAAFSPDGEKIVTVRSASRKEKRHEIRIFSLENEKFIFSWIFDSDFGVGSAIFSSDSKRIYFQSYDEQLAGPEPFPVRQDIIAIYELDVATSRVRLLMPSKEVPFSIQGGFLSGTASDDFIALPASIQGDSTEIQERFGGDRSAFRSLFLLRGLRTAEILEQVAMPAGTKGLAPFPCSSAASSAAGTVACLSVSRRKPYTKSNPFASTGFYNYEVFEWRPDQGFREVTSLQAHASRLGLSPDGSTAVMFIDKERNPGGLQDLVVIDMATGNARVTGFKEKVIGLME